MLWSCRGPFASSLVPQAVCVLGGGAVPRPSVRAQGGGTAPRPPSLVAHRLSELPLGGGPPPPRLNGKGARAGLRCPWGHAPGVRAPEVTRVCWCHWLTRVAGLGGSETLRLLKCRQGASAWRRGIPSLPRPPPAARPPPLAGASPRRGREGSLAMGAPPTIRKGKEKLFHKPPPLIANACFQKLITLFEKGWFPDQIRPRTMRMSVPGEQTLEHRN